MEKKLIGKVSHYYSKAGVAIVELRDELKVGEKISIEGVTTNLQQNVDSMQIEHAKIQKAKKGDAIGLKVKDRVRESDHVYKIVQ